MSNKAGRGGLPKQGWSIKAFLRRWYLSWDKKVEKPDMRRTEGKGFLGWGNIMCQTLSEEKEWRPEYRG